MRRWRNFRGPLVLAYRHGYAVGRWAGRSDAPVLVRGALSFEPTVGERLCMDLGFSAGCRARRRRG
jgi:hypothetical protein